MVVPCNGFIFFDGISRSMVSERVDRQAHGILKVCSRIYSRASDSFG